MGTMFPVPFAGFLILSEMMDETRFREHVTFHDIELLPVYPDAQPGRSPISMLSM